MKQLLPAAIMAIAIHGLLFIMDVPWAERAPVKPAEIKSISVVLTRENKEEKPAPAIPPAAKPLMPLEPASEQMIVPAPRLPQKTIHKRAEEKRSVPAKKKIPAPLPPPVVEAKPESSEKVVAEPIASVPVVPPVQEETSGAATSNIKTPPVSNEGFPAAAAGGNISEARPLYKKNPHPNYPDIARKRNAQGTVVILALVNEKGMVEEARVEISSGHALLDNAAIRAVKSWEFEPGRRGNNPVKSYVKLPVTFQLK